MADLRTFTYLDILQPQFTAFVASTARGYLPVTSQASLWVELEPAMDVNRITDVALKATGVRPAVQVVERRYGLLEVHSFDQGEVRQAGEAILGSLGLKEADRLQPKVMTEQIITNVSPYQAMLINRMRKGSMLLDGQTLYILEVHPAAYAALAANEAEKASDITIVQVNVVGAFGRIYLGGTESQIEEAAKAATSALEAVTGRKNTI